MQREDKVYFLIFAWLGATWFSHSLKFAWPAMCVMVGFYFFHNVIMAKGEKYISNSFMPFLLCGVVLILHNLSMNLAQLMSFTMNIYHRTWSGISVGARMFLDVSSLYVMFRCVSRYRERGSGIFFEGFSAGGNFFTLVLLMLGSFSYAGMLTYEGEGGDFLYEGSLTNINGIGPLFIQFFFMNLLAYKFQKHKTLKIYHAAFCAFDLLVVFIAQSKTSTGALLFSLIFAFALRKPKHFAAVVIAGSVMMFVFQNQIHGLMGLLPARYNTEAVTSSLARGGTGRSDVWRDYLTSSMSVQTLLVGQGHGGQKNGFYQRMLTYYRPHLTRTPTTDSFPYPHSSYVSIFIDIGTPGFILYLIITAKILFRLVAGVLHRKIHWAYLSMYITFVLWCFSEGGLFSDIYLLFTAAVLPEVSNKVDTRPRITMRDFYNMFFSRKFILAGTVMIFTALSFWYCKTSPQVYKSSCTITPSYDRELSGAEIIWILRGPSITEKTVKEFDLMNVYQKGTMSEAIDYAQRNLFHVNHALPGQYITLEILDTSPDRAERISDFMLDCLNDHVHEMYSAMNSGLLSLYAHAAGAAREELNAAEEDLLSFQKDNGIIIAQSQVNDTLGRIASIRNDITAKELEISALRSYIPDGNVRLRQAQAQLEAMKQGLDTASERVSAGNMQAAIIGYRDRARKVALSEIRLLDAMRAVDEAAHDPREFMPPVRIIDTPHGTASRFKPYRTAVMIIGTCTGFWLGVLLSILSWKLDKKVYRA